MSTYETPTPEKRKFDPFEFTIDVSIPDALAQKLRSELTQRFSHERITILVRYIPLCTCGSVSQDEQGDISGDECEEHPFTERTYCKPYGRWCDIHAGKALDWIVQESTDVATAQLASGCNEMRVKIVDYSIPRRKPVLEVVKLGFYPGHYAASSDEFINQTREKLNEERQNLVSHSIGPYEICLTFEHSDLGTQPHGIGVRFTNDQLSDDIFGDLLSNIPAYMSDGMWIGFIESRTIGADENQSV
jgi:hypothetical protein